MTKCARCTKVTLVSLNSVGLFMAIIGIIASIVDLDPEEQKVLEPGLSVLEHESRSVTSSTLATKVLNSSSIVPLREFDSDTSNSKFITNPSATDVLIVAFATLFIAALGLVATIFEYLYALLVFMVITALSLAMRVDHMVRVWYKYQLPQSEKELLFVVFVFYASYEIVILLLSVKMIFDWRPSPNVSILAPIEHDESSFRNFGALSLAANPLRGLNNNLNPEVNISMTTLLPPVSVSGATVYVESPTTTTPVTPTANGVKDENGIPGKVELGIDLSSG